MSGFSLRSLDRAVRDANRLVGDTGGLIGTTRAFGDGYPQAVSYNRWGYDADHWGSRRDRLQGGRGYGYQGQRDYGYQGEQGPEFQRGGYQPGGPSYQQQPQGPVVGGSSRAETRQMIEPLGQAAEAILTARSRGELDLAVANYKALAAQYPQGLDTEIGVRMGSGDRKLYGFNRVGGHDVQVPRDGTITPRQFLLEATSTAPIQVRQAIAEDLDRAGAPAPVAPAAGVTAPTGTGAPTGGLSTTDDTLRIESVMAQLTGYKQGAVTADQVAAYARLQAGSDNSFTVTTPINLDVQGGSRVTLNAGTYTSAQLIETFGNALELDAAKKQALATAIGAPVSPAPAQPAGPAAGATTPPPAGGATTPPPAVDGATTPAPATGTVAPVAIPAATGAPAKTYSLRTNPDQMPKITGNQVEPLQSRLAAAGFDLSTRAHPDGLDGMYGPKTEAAVNAIAAAAGVSPKDIDFGNPNDPETVKFNQALDARIAQRSAPAPAVAPVAPAAPAPEPVVNAPEGASIVNGQVVTDAPAADATPRGQQTILMNALMQYTELDNKPIAQRQEAAKHLVEYLREAAGPDGKIDITQRTSLQGDSGEKISVPAGSYTPEQLLAVVSQQNRIDRNMQTLVTDAATNRVPTDTNMDLGVYSLPYTRQMTQEEQQALAERGLRDMGKLSNGVPIPFTGIRIGAEPVDGRPGPVSTGAIRSFESASNLPADGVADPAMLEALGRAQQARVGLAPISAPTAVVAGDLPPAPSSSVSVNTPGQEARGGVGA